MIDQQVPITSHNRLRMLMLTHRTPFPPDRGDRIRSYNILKFLANHYDISLASLTNQPITDEQQTELESLTSQLSIQHLNTTTAKLRGARALITGQPITPACFHHPRLAQTIIDWHNDKPFDVVFTYCSAMLPYTRFITADDPDVRHIVDLIDVDSQKWQQYARETFSPMSLVYHLEAKRLRPLEAGHYDRIDAVTLVSPAETEVYRRHVTQPNNFQLKSIPNGVDLDYFTPTPDPENHNIVFTGVLDYRPNVEGLLWFANEVLPYVAYVIPDITLSIVGRHPVPAIQSLASHPNIKLVGPVPDVRPHLANASAVIAPLLIARGLQNKVLEAMASQRAVICSPAAAEGIHAEHEKHLLIANHPDQWVDQIVRTLNFISWRQNLAANARKQIETHYTWKKCLIPLIKLISPQAREQKLAA